MESSRVVVLIPGQSGKMPFSSAPSPKKECSPPIVTCPSSPPSSTSSSSSQPPRDTNSRRTRSTAVSHPRPGATELDSVPRTSTLTATSALFRVSPLHSSTPGAGGVRVENGGAPVSWLSSSPYFVELAGFRTGPSSAAAPSSSHRILA